MFPKNISNYARICSSFKTREKVNEQLIKSNNDLSVDPHTPDFLSKVFSSNIYNEKLNILIVYHHINNFPIYSDYCNLILDNEPNSIENINADVAVTTKIDYVLKYPERSIYLPCFITMMWRLNIEPIHFLEKHKYTEKKFCCFAYTNMNTKYEGVKMRMDFYYLMQRLCDNRVENKGTSCSTNISNKTSYSYNGNNVLYKNYKFVIAIENSFINGYMSEKLFIPILAGSIPIYMGAPDVHKYFNTKRFIHVRDFESLEKCIEYVKRVDENNDLYQSILNEPFLINNEIDRDLFSGIYGGKFYKQLKDKLPLNLSRLIKPCMLTSNNSVFVTFADGLIYNYDRVLKEAKDSNFFKEVRSYLPSSLPISFLNNHKKYMQDNQRGYGHWIWKPTVILDTMLSLKENDICCWADSGCTINYQGSSRMQEYYDILETHDIIAFQMQYLEKNWSKSYVINKIKTVYPDLNLESNPNQYRGGIIIFKVNSKTINFVKEWVDLCNDYKAIDFSTNVDGFVEISEFIENRNDQTIFSLLCKTDLGCKIYTCNDNWDDNFISDNNIYIPIIPTRKKC